MTRRNNKRNERKPHNDKTSDYEAVKAALGILMFALGNIAKGSKDEPFSGIRKVSDNHIESVVTVKSDGTATELPIPEGFEVFISEEGKPMIRKKIEGDGEPVNEQQPTTYEEVANQLYKDNHNVFYWSDEGAIEEFDCRASYKDLDNCMSEAQVKRLMAFNKLQNIALYLNKGWCPNFNCDEKKYFIMSTGFKKYAIGYNTYCNDGTVFFKTEELAEQAIRIMGEESLADLFDTDWYDNIR